MMPFICKLCIQLVLFGCCGHNTAGFRGLQIFRNLPIKVLRNVLVLYVNSPFSGYYFFSTDKLPAKANL